MKYRIILLLFISYFPLRAQISAYGLEYSRHLATQLNFNPQMPADGTFQWDYLKTNGIGIFLQYQLSKSLQVETKLKYLVKGFSERVQSLRVPGQVNTFFEATMHNRFRYLNMDANLKYILNHQSTVQFAPYIGLRNNFLLNYTLESDIHPINLTYPMKDYKAFKRYNLGMVLGIELLTSNLIAVSGEMNLDLNSITRAETLEVKNWLWSLNVGIHLQQILRFK
jgi:hypothetical protein